MRKLRYRKGFGVHSPFAYDLITSVIEEQNRYYSYNAIETFLRKILYPHLSSDKLAIQKRIEKKKSTLLFRLINRFKPKTVLEIGTSWGISTLYMSAPYSGIRQICIEPDEVVAALTKEVLQNASSGVRLISGSFSSLPQKEIKALSPVDFVLIHASRNALPVEDTIRQISPFLSTEAVVVVDGIRRNDNRQQEWSRAIGYQGVTVSMDLYDIGLLFFYPKLNKQHYIVSF